MGHPWLVVILVAVVMCSSWAIVGEAQTFSDLPPNHWGYEGLRDLVRAGLVEEYQQGQALLGPVSLSRYEVALLVGKVHQRLDHYQRKLVEKQLMLGTSMSDANVAQALAALDYTLWEQVFNFTLEHPPGDLTGEKPARGGGTQETDGKSRSVPGKSNPGVCRGDGTDGVVLSSPGH